MRAFVTRAADLLLATTIVENGLDIPSANTMLIDRADLYGLSQLYQLRGRVGRSDKAASCWLLVPPGMPLSDDARRRLRAIQEFSDLGAGFRIAAKDLEIRGAGNVLGGEQSGHIESVGFETYVNLLEEAMAELKGEPVPETRDVTLQLGVPLALPAAWIPEESLRMALYKRIAAASDEETLAREAAAAADRYGAPPPAFSRLLDLARLRLLARALGVKALQRRGDELAASLEKDHGLDPEKVVAMLRKAGALRVRPRRLPAAEGVRRNSGRRRRRSGPRGTGSPRSRRGTRAGAAGFASRGGRVRRERAVLVLLLVLLATLATDGCARRRSSRRGPAGNRRDDGRDARHAGRSSWPGRRTATSEDPKNVSPRVLSSLLDQYLEEVLLARAVEAAVPPVPGANPAEKRRAFLAALGRARNAPGRGPQKGVRRPPRALQAAGPRARVAAPLPDTRKRRRRREAPRPRRGLAGRVARIQRRAERRVRRLARPAFAHGSAARVREGRLEPSRGQDEARSSRRRTASTCSASTSGSTRAT